MWRFYKIFFEPSPLSSWGNFLGFIIVGALVAAPNVIAIQDLTNREYKNPLRVIGCFLAVLSLAVVVMPVGGNAADIIGAGGIILAAYIYTLFRNDALKRGRSWGTAWVIQGWIFALITAEILIVFLQFFFDAQVQ